MAPRPPIARHAPAEPGRASTPAPAPGLPRSSIEAGAEGGEDAAGEGGALGDEPGEVADRGGAGVEEGQGLVRRVDAAGADDVDGGAEALTRAPDVVERGRED